MQFVGLLLYLSCLYPSKRIKRLSASASNEPPFRHTGPSTWGFDLTLDTLPTELIWQVHSVCSISTLASWHTFDSKTDNWSPFSEERGPSFRRGPSPVRRSSISSVRRSWSSVRYGLRRGLPPLRHSHRDSSHARGGRYVVASSGLSRAGEQPFVETPVCRPAAAVVVVVV